MHTHANTHACSALNPHKYRSHTQPPHNINGTAVNAPLFTKACC